MNPESGVRAPLDSLTSDCDMPPLVGNPWPRPAARFAPARARNSWLLSSRYSCLRANIRPIAAVSTAPNRKQAIASGSSVVQIAALQPLDAEVRQPLRHLAEHFHAAPGEVEIRA